MWWIWKWDLLFSKKEKEKESETYLKSFRHLNYLKCMLWIILLHGPIIKMTTQAGSLYLIMKINGTKSVNGAKRMSLLKKEEKEKRKKKKRWCLYFSQAVYVPNLFIFIYSKKNFFILIFYNIFLRWYQPITSILDHNSLSSNQKTNRFLVYAEIESQIFYSTIKDFTSWAN